MSKSRARVATEISVVAVLVVLVAGVLFRTGLPPTTLSTSDGFTWLADRMRGEVVQVNPAIGEQENRLKVAPANNTIEVAQRADGLLVVTDLTTGTVTVIDGGTLATGGRWFGSGQSAIEVLLNSDGLYVVDRPRGTIQRLETLTARPIGPPWAAGGNIVDTALDGSGKLWALRGDGQLSVLSWSEGSGELADAAPAKRIDGAGPRSLLVSHDSGVTVIAPEAGVASRVGTGDDTIVETVSVPGKIEPAKQAPSDLVPVSVVDSGTVLLFHRGEVIQVDVGKLGCRKPSAPVVHRNRVYVACAGARKVVVLGRDGKHRPPDITMPAGDPELLVDDGKLFIHAPGGDTGFVVNENGRVTRTETHDETQPPTNPDNRPPPVVPTTKPPRQDRPQTGAPAPGGPGVPAPAPGTTSTPSAAPPPSGGTSPLPPPPPIPAGPKVPGAPTGVGISALFEYGTTLRVEAQWAAPADNGSPINGFALQLTTDRGYSQGFSLAALRSGPIEIPCGSRCHGMRVQADVRATNANGQGPVGAGAYSHNAPAQAPAAGEAVFTSVSASQAGTSTFYINANFDPPFAWRTFGGTCTLNWTGPMTGSRALSCWATSMNFTLSGGAGTYRFWVQAGTVRSNEISELAYREPADPPTCRGCHIP